MIKILGISGSLRAQSYNTALLRAAQADAGPETRFDIATLHGIPLYDGDLEEREGLPAAVVDLRKQVMASDGLIFATPEYNNGIPGVFKNAIDWLSRPPSDIPAVFGNRPVAVIGASAGGFGTVLAQNDWLPVLKTLGTRHYSGGRLLVARAGQVFNAQGELTDADLQARLRAFVAGFVAFVEESTRTS
ncbi:NADPH-dependent FMN reductase [Cupriavidus sp. MP-37]|uniref:NADPH-dependent FMN reductase n=1 Tax=Cupriavidus sp. MP-37 TaxID=2884455 RepID=UPI001D0B1E99|nr:NADPH-dependent FMN reductase [Cupriavidus sp. MP-37]UDM52703.1 NAD(P)H-dependent oxidoreductase [Cupriavidus sp. MP-37]